MLSPEVRWREARTRISGNAPRFHSFCLMKGKVIKQMKNGPYPAPESTWLVRMYYVVHVTYKPE